MNESHIVQTGLPALQWRRSKPGARSGRDDGHREQARLLLLLQGESRMAGRTNGFVAAYIGCNLVICLTALTDDPYPAAVSLLEHIEPHEAAAGVLAVQPRSRGIGTFSNGG
jgi:hypothetical protein